MKNNKFVFVVLIPAFVILGIFVIFPVIYGIGISLFDYNPLNTTNTFLGLENYKKLLQDDVFWKAVKNTIFFCVVAVALNIIITLFLAKIISVIPNKILRNVFRTILFIPCIAPMVGTSLIWKYGILATNGGVLNTILKWFGISPTNWFMTTTPMMMLIIVYTLWADLGYNVILFTAGMDNVPEEFEEAAILDGANAVQRFFRVKLPLMKRTFAFVSIMTMANYFQMFAQFRVFVANGGRSYSTMVLTNYIYKKSFTDFDMGYASAVAFALFIIVFIVAMVQNKILRSDWSY